MPFGFTNAPVVFQALVNDVLCYMINKFVFVYLDGLLLFSHSLQEHIYNVRAILQCLLQNQLCVKAKKCKFHFSTVSFLGFIVSANNIERDPEKGGGSEGMVHL